MKKYFLLPFIALLVVGCSNPTFDTSSEENFSTSLEKIGKSADTSEKQKLAEAVMFYSLKDLNIFAAEEAETPSETVKQKFEGKTLKEVISQYEQDKKKDLSKEIEQEIKILEEKKEMQSKATELSQKFEVSGRFELTEDYFGGTDARQKIRIKNNSETTISTFKVNTTLVSTDRDVPWGKDDVYYSIPGGLAPGEEKEMSFYAYDWENIDFGNSTPLLKTDLVFVEDSNEKKLFEAVEFTKEDAEKLEKLRKELASS